LCCIGACSSIYSEIFVIRKCGKQLEGGKNEALSAVYFKEILGWYEYLISLLIEGSMSMVM